MESRAVVVGSGGPWRRASRCGGDAEKKIPMKAGLGGGSSNAAATLLGLRRLWKLRLPDEQSHALAARLGSDVPFFLLGGTALGLGRGDEVYPLEQLPRYWVVLAIPEFGVATADAYRWFDEARKRGREGFSTRRPEKPSRPLSFRASARQRPGAAGHRAAPGDRPVEATAYGRRGTHGSDVGKRLDGVWRLHVGPRCRSCSAGGAKRRRPGPDGAICAP